MLFGGLLSEKYLWKQIKQTLQNRSPLLRSILTSVTLESSLLEGEERLVLRVPSLFHQNVLKNHLSDIQTQMKEGGRAYKSILIKPLLTKNSPKNSPVRLSCPPPFFSETKKIKQGVFFNQWTFSSFIQGPNNSFAFSLAQNVAKSPKKNKTNPLFIYGPSGLGKTHLLHAIGNTVEQQTPHLKALYLPAERFFNDCIAHIRKNEMPAFRRKYRSNTQILLLDDIQILGKGESTQEEFFHTFEHLKQNGCQIVLASDQKPKNIKGLKERIKTRFEGGIIADIQFPDKDTKIAIIKNKAQKARLNLSEEAISYIAHIPTFSIREIEGQINKIKMYCELQRKPLSLKLIQNLLPNEPPPVYEQPLSFLSPQKKILLKKT